jgi:hypothetical protein
MWLNWYIVKFFINVAVDCLWIDDRIYCTVLIHRVNTVYSTLLYTHTSVHSDVGTAVSW